MPDRHCRIDHLGRAWRKTMDKIEVQNVNHPGSVRTVDAALYQAMKACYLAVLPKASPGLTLAEIRERLHVDLPQELFPNGAKAGWWAKTVQLDLEAKRVIKRVQTSPLRLYRGS
jgi:hypothetical protein